MSSRELSRLFVDDFRDLLFMKSVDVIKCFLATVSLGTFQNGVGIFLVIWLTFSPNMLVEYLLGISFVSLFRRISHFAFENKCGCATSKNRAAAVLTFDKEAWNG